MRASSHVPADTALIDVSPSRRTGSRSSTSGGIEYQLCESLEPDGRFATWIRERGAEGLHHICYEVDDIDEALDARPGAGRGTPHLPGLPKSTVRTRIPEGWVAFLDNDAGGIEIEFMQVYTPEQLEEVQEVKGI